MDIQANRQMLVSNAFGTHGSIWEIETAYSAEDKMEGDLIVQDATDAAGNNFEGMFQVLSPT